VLNWKLLETTRMSDAEVAGSFALESFEFLNAWFGVV
jgi:hypothetical protein